MGNFVPWKARFAELHLAVFALFVSFALAIVVAAWSADTIRDESRRVSATHEGLVALKNVLSILQDAETGQRGFLLSGNERYLEPYLEARARIDGELGHLDEIRTDVELDEESIAALRTTTEAKFTELAETLAAYKRAGMEAARAVLLTHRGQAAMDAVRAQIGRLEQRAFSARERRIATRERAVRQALWGTVLCALLGTVVTAAAVRLVQRQTRLQGRLDEERELLQATLLSIGDGVIVTDEHARVTTMNGVAEALTGWREGSWQGRNLEEVFVIVNQQTRASVENPALRALHEGQIFGLANHTVLLARDGSERPIDDSAAPVRGVDGRTAGAVLVFRDVTERYASEEKLRASEELLRRVIDSMAAFVAVLDEEGRILEVNRAPLEIAGLLRADVLGRKFWDCPWWDYDPAVQARLEAAFQLALSGEQVRYDETVRVANDGRAMVDFAMGPVRVDGRVRYVVPSAIDITTRKQAEQNLVAAIAEERRQAAEADEGRRLLDALMEYVPEGVTIAHRDEGIRMVSRHGQRMLQRSIEQLRVSLDAQPAAWSILEPDGRQLAAAEALPLTRAVRQGEITENEEWIMRRADGVSIWVLCNAGPIRNQEGGIIGGVIVWRDVTDVKRIEEQLREAARQKDAFLATLAHELRNPLAPIRHGLELLAHKRDEEAATVIAMLKRQVANMVRLIDDLLDLSRITTGKIVLQRRIVTLQDVAAAAAESVQPAMQRAGHRFSADYAEAPLFIDGDPVRLEQILVNVLTNAAKYTPPGGTIRLRVACEGDCARVEIADNGVGIPAAMLAEVFDMFTQVARDLEHSQGGLGIGLALVRRLMELHGGSIEVHSEGQGRGTTVTLRLPLAQGAAMPAIGRTTETLDAPVSTQALRMLLVDDNADSAESLGMLLAMDGHVTCVCHDGASALAQAALFRPDVVLLDIGLPDIDGFEVARRARALPSLRGAFLVAITGWGTEADVTRAREAGFDAHLTKPIEYRELMRVLRRRQTA
ncbi:MAG TPA: PAS domain S-box protein [Gammaproteobacteria bacterium]|nr:PAS domain S-box protein [Gammaproteobacteria bacterium]